MPHLGTLGFQVTPVVDVYWSENRHLVNDFKPIAFNAGQLLRAIGEDANLSESEVSENLGADAVFAQVGRQAESFVRLDGVHALILQPVRSDLVMQADSPAL